LIDRGFGLVTLHRQSNVDAPDTLAALLEALTAISRRLPLVWPMHPRTRASIERFGLVESLRAPGLVCLPPQGYLEMVGLMNGATVVLTDSGGVQEETTALGVPCVTLRENTERPITVEQGTNTLIGRDFAALHGLVDAILAGGGKRGRLPELWDGRTAGRIAAHLAQWLRAPRAARVSA
jgi:UDP-N-acetylglucosamine 2-epimerase (non-hydrolysing)